MIGKTSTHARRRRASMMSPSRLLPADQKVRDAYRGSVEGAQVIVNFLRRKCQLRPLASLQEPQAEDLRDIQHQVGSAASIRTDRFLTAPSLRRRIRLSLAAYIMYSVPDQSDLVRRSK